jgi:HK97 gp10 family phage protein
MIDVSDIVEFAAKLATPIVEEPWRDEWSKKVAAEMKTLAPVKTGALRDSIHVTDEGVEVGVPYGRFVEYGTAHIAPQPFTAPAVHHQIHRAAVDAGRRVIRHLT